MSLLALMTDLSLRTLRYDAAHLLYSYRTPHIEARACEEPRCVSLVSLPILRAARAKRFTPIGKLLMQ
jgi:hypothetical protein